MKRLPVLFALFALISLASLKAQQNTPLLLNPEMGKQYLMTANFSVAETREETADRRGKNKHLNVNILVEMTAEKINTAGNIEVKCLLKRVSTTMSKRNDTISFDSDMPTEMPDKAFSIAINTLKTTPMLLEMSKQGQLVSVKGFDAFDAKLREANNENIDSISKLDRLERTKEYAVAEKWLISIFNHLTDFYAEGPFQVGDVKVAEKTDSIPNLVVKGTQTISVTDDTKETVFLNGTRPLVSQRAKTDDEGEKNRVKPDITADKTFEVALNKKTGLIEKSNFTITVIEPLTKEEIAEGRKPEIFTATISLAITPVE